MYLTPISNQISDSLYTTYSVDILPMLPFIRKTKTTSSLAVQKRRLSLCDEKKNAKKSLIRNILNFYVNGNYFTGLAVLLFPNFTHPKTFQNYRLVATTATSNSYVVRSLELATLVFIKQFILKSGSNGII